MNIDEDYNKVINELETNFGWKWMNKTPKHWKDLINDVIKATKQVKENDILNAMKEYATQQKSIDYPSDEEIEYNLTKDECLGARWAIEQIKKIN